MAQRFALEFLAAGSVAMLASFVWPHPWAEILFALLAAAFPVALIVVGTLGYLGAQLPALGVNSNQQGSADPGCSSMAL